MGILTKLFGCQSAFNLLMAQARSKLAGAYRFRARFDEETSELVWARRAKHTSISAYNMAERIIVKDSLVLTHMRRMIAWTEEDHIIKTVKNRSG